MITLEMVEKLCSKADVTYDEARSALTEAGGDILEAIIALEKQGKVKAPDNGGKYSSQDSAIPQAAYSGQENADRSHQYTNHKNSKKFSSSIKNFIHWCGRIINKGNNNFLDMTKEGQTVIVMPVTAVVLLLVFAFWIVVPISILALFFGYKFSFRGKELGTEKVNSVMEKVSQTTDNIKQEIKHDLD
ncbi:MAG: DUF4342 domain-containing protein [Syntrophomonadaceae bacterium]|jgi:hypothetical protein|nr:DUF4342 domain-containing protein [Syntrophomonadaceae bacterium]